MPSCTSLFTLDLDPQPARFDDPRTVLQASKVGGSLIRIARTESDMELKGRAVEALAMMDSPKATEYLLELLDE